MAMTVPILDSLEILVPKMRHETRRVTIRFSVLATECVIGVTLDRH
jgi:hypothetical protein